MKKILSILIAISLIISILPAAFAAGEVAEDPVAKTYLFNSADIKLNVTTALLSSLGVGATDKNGADIYETYGWRYFDMPEEVKKDESTANFYAAVGSRTNRLIFNTGAAFAFALMLKAPDTAGFYIPSVNTLVSESTSRLVKMYMSRYDESKLLCDEYTVSSNEIMSTTATKWLTVDYSANMAVYTTSGEPIISAIDSEGKLRFANITLNPILNPVITTITDGGSTLSFDLADGDTTNDSQTVTLSTTVSGKDTSGVDVEPIQVSNNFVTYRCEDNNPDADVVTVDANGTITANAGGTATVWAETKDYNEQAGTGYKSTPVTVTVTAPSAEPEKTDLEEAFTVSEKAISEYNEPTVTGLVGGKVTEATYKGNGAYDLTAPATNENGGNFLYWAKGLSAQKRILIGKTNILTDYVPGENGKEYLIAVYDNELSGKEEYYNANGQLIPGATNTKTVSMPGYGSTSTWERYGDTNIWVAQYEKEALNDVTVTAVDGAVNGSDSATVAFGTEVTCTADAERENFKCWKKSNINGDEIVSVDKTYKFKAWEDCTVTAVYEEHTPLSSAMKIIIDNFEVSETETGVMAEFIGFDGDDVNVVEKGIMFTATGETEATKIAMTTTDNQFTVIADAGKYVGYAILRNGTAYNLITDGSYEHN